MDSLTQSREAVNKLLDRYGVRFGIYKEGKFHEQLFPFDSIPRVIERDAWKRLEMGLRQRVDALNAFLRDIYSDAHIIADKMVPEDFVFSSSGYLPQCRGITPPRGIHSHISGIDLVEGNDGKWYILEDNLRIPSGASYPMIARKITRKVSPETFVENAVCDNRNYAAMLRSMMDYVNTGGINVILTPGRYNSAYFEHSYFAELTGATLAFPGDLITAEDGYVYYRGIYRERVRVGAIYRRISDEYLDPLTFRPDSLLGVAGLMGSYAAGKVAVINAPGNGVADDKGIYCFVPRMIRYYLNEEPILCNAPTYLPFEKEGMQYVMDNLGRLVIKDVSEAGGYGVVFGSDLSPQKLEELRALIISQPRRWIAQEVIHFKDLDILDDDGNRLPRKADLRAFVISGETTEVWRSGLTRFSRNPDSFVVNSSQGGGFKDTWVLA